MAWNEKAKFVANNTNKTSTQKEDREMTRAFITYFLQMNGNSIKVCKVFFSSTLSIGDEQIKKHAKHCSISKKKKGFENFGISKKF